MNIVQHCLGLRLVNNVLTTGKHWTHNRISSVIWDNQQSRSFPCRQGVQQGGVLSPFLYCLFVDELLDNLAQSGFGVSIDDFYCGSPMYADDLALVASSPEELQATLDIVATYADKWCRTAKLSYSVLTLQFTI